MRLVFLFGLAILPCQAPRNWIVDRGVGARRVDVVPPAVHPYCNISIVSGNVLYRAATVREWTAASFHSLTVAARYGFQVWPQRAMILALTHYHPLE